MRHFCHIFLLFKASKPLGIMKSTASCTQLTMQLTSEASHLSSSVSGVMKLLPSILSSKYCLNYLIGYYLWFVTCDLWEPKPACIYCVIILHFFWLHIMSCWEISLNKQGGHIIFFGQGQHFRWLLTGELILYLLVLLGIQRVRDIITICYYIQMKETCSGFYWKFFI